MGNRYKVVEGSESGHCCFDYTIVDTTKVDWTDSEGITHYIAVCECFDVHVASLICFALNKIELQ